MGITQSLCDIAKLAFLNGNISGTDSFKLALYTISASLDHTTLAYTNVSESVGTGYFAGGLTLSGFTSSLINGTASISWAPPSIATASISAFGGLIYDVTRANLAVAVVNFGITYVATSGTFTVNIPGSGLIDYA